MFRLQDKVPEIYVEGSRDFQLFCRLYDVVQWGTKFGIDSISKISSTQHCASSLLPLLQTKLGLFTSMELSDYEMRQVLSVYTEIVRVKGTYQAVHLVLLLFQRCFGKNFPAFTLSIKKDTASIVVEFQNEIHNKKLLMELLEIVAPVGYSVTCDIKIPDDLSTEVVVSDEVEFITDDDGDTTTDPNFSIVHGGDPSDDSLLRVVGLTSVHNNEKESENVN